jgi:hypothetical protein
MPKTERNKVAPMGRTLRSGKIAIAPTKSKYAYSTDLVKNQPDSYYKKQNDIYFDSLESKSYCQKTPFILPSYSVGLVRYEWPPWLLLTGLGSTATSSMDRVFADVNPCVVVDRKHVICEQNPFGRSLVTVCYGKGSSLQAFKIYEEFTFNDQVMIGIADFRGRSPLLRHGMPQQTMTGPLTRIFVVFRLWFQALEAKLGQSIKQR